MPTIKYPNNPNVETAFVEQDDGTKNRVVLTAAQDISTIEYPNNPNSTKAYIIVNGKKQRVVMTADIAGGGGGGGAVSSVNGKTGAVVLTASDVGAATAAQGALADTAIQSVKTINNQSIVGTGNVDIGGLPSQTGNAGKFLTTDGTDASWATVNALTNNTTANNSIGISDVQVTRYNCVVIGTGSKTAANRGTAIGDSATTGSLSVALGSGSNAGFGSDYSTRKDYVTAIGANTNATANNAIAIGYNCANSTAQTLAVCVDGTNSVTLVSSDGTIPTARLTKVNSTITLTAAGWSSNTQTVNVTGMTATGVVLVSPDPTDQADYTSAGVYCTAQAAGTLTFTCDTVPSGDIDVNVVML